MAHTRHLTIFPGFACFLPALVLFSGCADQGPTIVVEGRVVGSDSRPVSGVAVGLDGTSALVTTDAAGRFTLSNVPRPYNLILRDTADRPPEIVLIENLTRSDPTAVLELRGGVIPSDAPATTIRGAVTGAGIPASGNRETLISITAPHASGSIGFATAGARYEVQAYATEPVTGRLVALQIDTAGGHERGPAAYISYGERSVAIAGPGIVDGQDINLLPAVTDSVSGVFVPPAGYSIGTRIFQILLGDPSTAPAAEELGRDTRAGSSFIFRTTTQAAPFGFQVIAEADGGAGEVILYWKNGLKGGGVQNQTVQLPLGIVMGKPADGGMMPNGNDQFTWSGPGDGVFRLLVNGPSPTGFPLDARETFYEVVTTEQRVTASTLARLGLVPPQNSSVVWMVLGYGPFSSTDEASGPAGFAKVTDYYQVSGPLRTALGPGS